MPDQTENTQEDRQESSPDAAQNTEHMIPKSRFDQVNEERKSLLDRLAELEQANEEQQRKAQEEQGKYKELYEQTLSQLEGLKPKAAEADTLRAAIAESNKARIEQIPETHRGLVPEYDDPVKVRQWLDANASLLTGSGPAAPSLDGGAGNADRPNGGKVVKLTTIQKEAARRAGMTEDEYIKYMGADQPLEPDDELDRALRS